MEGDLPAPAGHPAGWRSVLRALWRGVLAAVVGALSAGAALGFLVLIGAIQLSTLGAHEAGLLNSVSALPWWRIIAVSTGGGLLVGLLVRFVVPGRRNYGPGEIIESVREGAARMSLPTGLASAAVSVISIGTGASVGRYGPAVHLGATLGAWLGDLFRLDRADRVALLGAGVAAAIAAAFNAPLAGVLFAHEVVVGSTLR